MSKFKLKVNQNKLEIAVAIGFSLIIFIMSSTNIGYIPISPYRNLDMAIIPAIFAAMIGGYRVGIPVAILWSIVTYYNPASNLQIFTLWGLMVNRIVLVTVAYHAYKVCKKYYQYSPANVYRAIIAAVTAKNIVSNIILVYILANVEKVFKFELWIRYTAQQYVLELALCSLAMMFLIKHLRQVHILNGIKRREKAKALSKA
jgi:riboflavin transporter FmnP